MDTPLETRYDEVADTLSIQAVPPYPEQVTDQLEYNLFLRRNPRTNAVEGLEILFFTRWLLKRGQTEARNLRDLFRQLAA